MKTDELTKLAAERVEARLHLQNLGVMNSVGLTPAERIRVDLELAKAQARWLAAERAYNAAIEALAKESEDRRRD